MLFGNVHNTDKSAKNKHVQNRLHEFDIFSVYSDKNCVCQYMVLCYQTWEKYLQTQTNTLATRK